MTDVAIVFSQALGVFDVAMNGDLLLDDGLETAVILSLLLDRPALPGDVLPDPKSTNRRGWWGNAFLPALPDGQNDFYGSRLWLLKRAEQTQATLQAATNYCYEALNWLLVDGVAGSVVVNCSYPSLARMNINTQLIQNGGQRKFNTLWSFS